MQGLWNKTVERADAFLRKNDPFFHKAGTMVQKRFWGPLKTILFSGILLLCVSCLAYAAYGRITDTELSFMNIYGEVRAVETDGDGQIVLTVPYGETGFQESTLRVHIDQKTRVYSLYPEKVRISAEEIRVGDIVEGVLRKGSEGLHDVMAKEIGIVTRADSAAQ